MSHEAIATCNIFFPQKLHCKLQDLHLIMYQPEVVVLLSSGDTTEKWTFKQASNQDHTTTASGSHKNQSAQRNQKFNALKNCVTSFDLSWTRKLSCYIRNIYTERRYRNYSLIDNSGLTFSDDSQVLGECVTPPPSPNIPLMCAPAYRAFPYNILPNRV